MAGDLLDPATVRSAFAGMDGVFLLNAVSATECHEGLMAVNGARMAGVKKVVYLSVHGVDKAPHLPHFGAKLPVEAALKASGLPFTILRPNNFFQNDTGTKTSCSRTARTRSPSATSACRAWTFATSRKPPRSPSRRARRTARR